MTKPSFITHAVLQRQPDRDQLQSDVDRFLAEGGKVQQLAPGQASGMSEQEIAGLRKKAAFKRRGEE